MFSSQPERDHRIGPETNITIEIIECCSTTSQDWVIFIQKRKTAF